MLEEEELNAKISDTTARGEAELTKQTYAIKANAVTINSLKAEALALRESAQHLRRELAVKSSTNRLTQKKQMRQRNDEMKRYLGELEKSATTGRHSNSQLTSKVLKFNKELADLKVRPRQIELAGAKGAYNKASSENKTIKEGLEQLKGQHSDFEKTVQQTRLEGQRMEETKQQLEGTLVRLYDQLKQTSKPSSPLYKSENSKLQQRLNEVEGELEECRREARNSRDEVSKVCSEIENYARILEAMEEKLTEAENRTMTAEQRRDEAVGQMQVVRQRYIAMIASSK